MDAKRRKTMKQESTNEHQRRANTLLRVLDAAEKAASRILKIYRAVQPLIRITLSKIERSRGGRRR